MIRIIMLCLLFGLSMTSLGQGASILFEIEGPETQRTPVSHLITMDDQLFVGTGGLRVLEYDLEGELIGTIIDMPGQDTGPWSNLYIENGNFIGHGGESGYEIFISEHAIDGSQITYANVTSGQSGTGELIEVNGDWHLLWASNCCGTGQTWDTELKKFSGHSDEVIWNSDLCYECNNWAGSCSHGQDYPIDLEFFDNHLFAFKSNVTSPCYNQIGIQKINLMGELQWGFEFPGERYVIETIVFNDEMFVLGYAGESPSRQPFLWKLNAQGEVVWEHVFSTEFSDMEPIDLLADANGNLRIGMIENGGFRLDEVSPISGEQISAFNIPIQQEIQSFGLYGSILIQLGMNEFVLGYNWGSWYDDSRFSLVKFSLNLSPGCTDSTACNYDTEATSDDGSCIPSGCMETDACNYNALAECDGEACDYTCCPGPGCCLEGTVWDAELGGCIPLDSSCPHDLDFDGVVGVNDLMELLSEFGTDCPGPEEPATPEFTCGDPVSYHGYDYATVQIGEQCWFAENLRTELYRNGDSILGGLTNEEWGSTALGAQAFYDYDSLNLIEYGRLYNFNAVIDFRGVCPVDWHVPSDEEFSVLMEFAGGEAIAGEQLKATTTWPFDSGGVDNYGFNALPAGSFADPGFFSDLSAKARFWSNTEVHENAAWGRELNSSTSSFRWDNGKGNGFSVRCLKD